MCYKSIIALLFIFFFPLLSYAQQTGVITGNVKKLYTDGSTESLENAEITLLTSTGKTLRKISTSLTDENGRFTVILEAGTYNLKVSLLGYKPSERTGIEIKPGDTVKISFTLSEESYVTDEIDVISERFRQAQNDMRTSLLNISPKTSKMLPGVVEDVLRTLQSMPGVSAPNDFSSQLIVRGSGPDQNLIIMDDIEIFNPYRLYGVFSMFNPETLAEINLITGGFPSKYGDRLSAVLDITNREGNKKTLFGAFANVNIANANLVFNGKIPVKSIPGSWIISTRRTYYDLILGPFAKNAGLIDESASFPSFEDIQLKLALGPFKNHKVIANAIYSRDGVDIIPGSSKEMEDSVSVRDVTYNDVLSLAWHYAPNSEFLTRTTISWYRNKGDANFGGEILDPVIDREIYDPEIRDSLKEIGLYLGMGFQSKYIFRKYSFTNNTIFNSANHLAEIGTGFDVIKTDLSFTLQIDDRLKSFLQNNPNFSSLDESFFEGKNYWRINFYLQDRMKISDKFYIQPGVRFDYFDILTKAYLSPRLNFSYAFDKLTTLRIGTGVYYQSAGYEKLIDGQVFYDLSPEKAKKLDAERSIHYILGFERWLNEDLFFKFETYYKKFDNLIVQEKLTGYRYEFFLNDPNNTDPSYIRNPVNWTRNSGKTPFDSLTTTPVNGATGKSYGFEVYLEKKSLTPQSKLSGWISYSLSWANRERDGLFTPFRYDRRHTLNIVANYRILRWLEVGARFNFTTGFPVTKPVGIKPRVVGDSLAVLPVLNVVQFDFDFGGEANKYASKFPAYHRLDIRATAYTRFWGVEWSFYLDIINVYNRKNVIGFDYYIDENLNVKEKTVGQFPILPTIGISARF